MIRWHTQLPPLFSVLCAVVLLAPAFGADWPQFRGPNRTNISKETGLLRQWPAGGPKVLWTIPVAQGYAGAAIVGDRLYHHDYDEASFEWRVYCRSMTDGKEIWRYTEERRIRPNHGITRTVPAVDGELVFAFDPKCVLHCLEAATGEEVWRKSMVSDYGSRIPSWYNGQCPLLEADRVIIAPAGDDVLLMALEKRTGKELWRTPNPEGRKMSHASPMPAVLGGVKQYLYCTLEGPLGVAADDGRLLWQFPYKFNVAIAPSPLAIDSERVFMTAGYDAGSVMLRVKPDGDAFKAEEVFRLKTTDWNAEVQTPIVHAGHLFGVGKERRGLFTCLDLDGKIVWTSMGEASFELGSFILADGMFFVVEGATGMLRLIEASTEGYHELASAQVLAGPDAWGPPALSQGRLVVRDMARMVCLRVGPAPEGDDG